MSKIACKCGHIIVDAPDAFPSKGRFQRAQDVEAYRERFKLVDDFLDAIKKGERETWIYHTYGERYPLDKKDILVIKDILWQTDNTLFQCDKCGRILMKDFIQDKYYSFYPEEDDSRDVLKPLV
jgi:hypothetical protein